MYKEDLSTEIDRFGNEITYIGWLEVGKKFATSKADDYFISCLWDYCFYKINSMRGFHHCDLCNMPHDVVPTITYEGETLKFGFSEIRVFDGKGKIYAAPNLIFHYVTEHSYAPPKEFVDAVCYGIDPNSYEYHRLLGELVS